MNKKFMQTLDTDVYRQLNTLAKERGIPVQELLRAVILPDWMKGPGGRTQKKRPNGTG